MRFLYKILINLILCLLLAMIRVRTNTTIENNNITDEDDKTFLTNSCNIHDCSDRQIELKPECFECKFNYSCVYGTRVNTTCTVKNDICPENKVPFQETYWCAFCYQLPPEYYRCMSTIPCQLYSRTKSVCTVNNDVLCLGHRKFVKYTRCEYRSVYKWSTALILSITLGGFGVDRFYLGNWQEGIGKLFSFGGLGIWTLIDVILIATGYLKPNDGSIYL